PQDSRSRCPMVRLNRGHLTFEKDYVMKRKKEYQPKTGEPCHCKPGVERSNCPDCEGTGMRIDFAAIRARPNEKRNDPVRICINVEGGVIQSIFADRNGVSAVVVDYDAEDEENPTPVPQEDGTTAPAIVAEWVVGVLPADVDMLFKAAGSPQDIDLK